MVQFCGSQIRSRIVGIEVGLLDFEEDSSTLSRSLIAIKRCS